MGRLIRSSMFCIAFSLMGISASCADAIILESDVATFAVGAQLAAGEQVMLAQGQSLVLLDRVGRVRHLTGPIEHLIDGDTNETLSTRTMNRLADMVVRRTDGAQSVGGARGGVFEGVAQVNQIPVGGSGRFCLVGGASLFVVRGAIGSDEVEQSDTLTIQELPAGASVSLEFEAGATQVPWPSSIEIGKRGSQVFLRLDSSPLSGSRVFVTTLPEGSDENLESLVVAGCLTQAEGLLASLIAEGDE